jgi:hypothetical protein
MKKIIFVKNYYKITEEVIGELIGEHLRLIVDLRP